MDVEFLQIVWFIVLGALLAGYACLDGFDLGVGILQPFQRTEDERQTAMTAIGPLWDGNEVWLVTFGGALFAVFPAAYAAAFSGFYLPFMLLLFALIFRGVALEFRSKQPSAGWRFAWDIAFFLSSTLTTFLFGVAVGNMFGGLPLGQDGFVRVSLLQLLQPYAVVVGLFAVATFAMHGSIYLYLKTEGDHQKHLHQMMWTCFGLFLVLYQITTIATLYFRPESVRNFEDYPWAWAFVVGSVLAIANIPRCIFRNRPFQAFLSSCAVIASLVVLFGLALYPNLVTSTVDPEYSLTVHNASSSRLTLEICLWVAVLGMPFVVAYTAGVYWVFRGKVRCGYASEPAGHVSEGRS